MLRFMCFVRHAPILSQTGDPFNVGGDNASPRSATLNEFRRSISLFGIPILFGIPMTIGRSSWRNPMDFKLTTSAKSTAMGANG